MPKRSAVGRYRSYCQIANLKAKGIPDWQILSTWSEIAQQQGNYAAADTLASAAFELGKPALVNALILT